MVELDQFKYTLSTYDETLKEVKDPWIWKIGAPHHGA